MKRYITRWLAFCLVLIATFTIIKLTNAAAPGSNKDPLVTKSYIDKRISELEVSNATQIKSLEKKLNRARKRITKLEASSGKYIEVLKGKTVTMNEGSTLVLISGKASIVGPRGANLLNLTKGRVLKPGKSVPRRNLLSSAISDGRGVKAQTKIFIRASGNYIVS